MEGKMREKGRVKSIFSLLLVIVMVLGMMPAVAFAASSSSTGQVHVIVENTIYTVANDSAPWEGVLLDTWVNLDDSMNMALAVKAAVEAKGYTQTGAESGYITEINGLVAYSNNQTYEYFGWMGTLNDWFTSEGLSNYSVANGKLEAGDEIRMMYSKEMGADLGGSFSNNNTTLAALSLQGGTLSPTFSPETLTYTFDVGTTSDPVKIVPTAANKNFLVRIYNGSKMYKRGASMYAVEGDTITIVINEQGTNPTTTMNNAVIGDYTSGPCTDSTTYTLNVVGFKPEPRHSSGGSSASDTTATTAPVEVKAADGSKSTTTTDANGVAKTEATVSAEAAQQAAKENKPVALAMNAAEASTDAAKAPAVTVDLPAGTSKAKVEIPVKDVNNSTVAVLVKADGTEEVIAKTMVTENGIVAELNDGETIKIVDNHKDFNDVTNHWAKDDIDFITARNIFNGVGGGNFDANGDMTRGMLMTVLARYDGTDASGSEWKEKGTAWAKEKGVSDGTALDEKVTREQLVTMLWRYAGSPVATDAQTANFNDAAKVQDFAKAAMDWAVESGLIKGSDNNIDPDGNAQRGQLAAIMHRFMIMMEGK